MSNSTHEVDELLLAFIDESVDALRLLPQQLAEYRAVPANSAPLHAVFRTVHSIKGNAGFFGLTAIKTFSHALENTLDEIRNGVVTLSSDMERHLALGFVMLDDTLQRVGEGIAPAELGEAEQGLLQQVTEEADRCRGSNQDTESDPFLRLTALALELEKSTLPQVHAWGQRLSSIILEITGEVPPPPVASTESISPATWRDFSGSTFAIGGQDVTPQLRPFFAMLEAVDAGSFKRPQGESFLAAANEFEVLCTSLNDEKTAETVNQAAADFRTILESPLDVDSMLISLVWDRLRPALAAIQTGGTRPTTTKPAEQATPAAATPASTDSVADKPKEVVKESAARTRMIRIKEERLDGFLDDVSSLFITCERLKDVQGRMTSSGNVRELVEELRQIGTHFSAQTSALQQSVVALRKVPVHGLLSKFPGMARTLAAKLEKKLDVTLIGEATEVDKSLIEDLDSPLTHMVRNVCDHGIEPPAERLAAGKSEAGLLTLKCELTKSHVVITITDNGRGIDPKRLRKKAVEKGVLTQAQVDALSDEAAVELIFHPGFSTAEKISDVSGRGVGLDVVRTTLKEHNGDVKVSSTIGVGTTFQLIIPIRTAVVVVEGLLVAESDNHFVIPFEHIQEIVGIDPADIRTVHGEFIATVRGEPFAAVPLSRILGLEESDVKSRQLIEGVIINCKYGQACLLVDHVVGQRKVVVNSLNDKMHVVDTVAGVAQLGGGRLSIVLSAPDLVKSISAPATLA